jgi:DNA-binding transcriptional regulator WhiA
MNVTHLDSLFLSGRNSYEIAKLLLEHQFPDWTYKKLLLMGAEEINIKYNNRSYTTSSSSLSIRRYLVTDFYQLLCTNKVIYISELSDFTKNNDYHYQLQEKIRSINTMLVLLENVDFHDDVIYYMTILS